VSPRDQRNITLAGAEPRGLRVAARGLTI